MGKRWLWKILHGCFSEAKQDKPDALLEFNHKSLVGQQAIQVMVNAGPYVLDDWSTIH